MVEGNKECLLMGTKFLLGVMKLLKIQIMLISENPVNILKT